MIFLQILLLLFGFVLLVKGADFFVDGAAGVAGKAKIPELVIGLTVVAFGTSAPELSVSLQAALGGSAGITIGNVLGSNITNILLILGLSAVFRALPVGKSSLKIDLPFVLFISALFIALGGIDNTLGLVDGIVMVALLIAYVVFLVWDALRTRKKQLELGVAFEEEEEKEEVTGAFNVWYEGMKEKTWFLFLILAIGLACIVWGADFVVNSATYIAEVLNVDDRIIGLTVVAIGTSLPELVTSVTAAIKGKTDIAVGNIIGSNIFNVLCVAGLTAIITPLEFTSAFVIDGIIALAATVLLAALAYLKGHKIGRVGGIIMLAGFVAYYVYLFAAL